MLPVGHQLHHLSLDGQLRTLHGRRWAPRGVARRGVRLRVGPFQLGAFCGSVSEGDVRGVAVGAQLSPKQSGLRKGCCAELPSGSRRR